MDKMKYILDTSALLTFFEEENGADTVQNFLEQAKRGDIEIITSFVTYVEVYYITMQEQGEQEAKLRISLMNMLALTIVESSPSLGLVTGQIKAAHRLSFADAWIAATALTFDAILVHKDPEFEQLNPSIKLFTLPYKHP
jgi:uncharacterized protein